MELIWLPAALETTRVGDEGFLLTDYLLHPPLPPDQSSIRVGEMKQPWATRQVVEDAEPQEARRNALKALIDSAFGS